MMPDDGEGFQGPEYSGSLPDSNTAEAILYGDAYSWIKSALWAWDEMEDYLTRKLDSLDGQVMERMWAYEVLTRNRYMIFAKTPPVNEVQRLKDLFTLRSMVKVAAGLRKIREYRAQNISWARMKGIQQYVKGLEGRGISELEWKAATADYTTQPIDYDFVHGLRPEMIPGEDIDLDEAMREILGDKEYDEMLEKMFGEEGDFEDDIDEEYEEEDEESEEDDIDEEEDGEGHEDEEEDLETMEPPWEGFYEDLETMFAFPDVALASSSGETDLCAEAAAWWRALDIDDRAIVDYLIGCAEALA